jgi:hypothetical protein
MRQQYGHDVDEQTGRRVIAPIGAGGTVETNMVLNDALLATSIARARGSSVAEALNEVRVSKTSMSSSGGRLFVGDSQVVLMSGSLEAVESAAQAYGIKVQPFGEVKNVFRESSAQPDMSSRGVLAPGSVVVSADREALATKIVNEMLVGSKFGMRQLFISKDEALRSLVYEKLKKANVSPAYFDHNPNFDPTSITFTILVANASRSADTTTLPGAKTPRLDISGWAELSLKTFFTSPKG